MKIDIKLCFGWLFTVVTLIFIVLKINEVIDWNWFWVLFPAIIEIGVAVIAILVISIIAIVQKHKYGS